MLMGAALALHSSNANAELQLRKIGEPMFDITGHSLGHMYRQPNGGSNQQQWVRSNEAFNREVWGDDQHNMISENDCSFCPITPHDGPYDQEYNQVMVNAGMLLTDSYLSDDLNYPSSVFFRVMVTPNSSAPNGSSFDDPNGPILPQSIFPLQTSSEHFANGSRLRFGGSFDVQSLAEKSPLQYTDEQGTQHTLDYTGLNDSHLWLTFTGWAQLPAPADFFKEFSLPGEHVGIATVLDVDGNGWEITSTMRIVAEDTNIAGDLNYSGAIDLGDYKIMSQNVALMPTDGHEFSAEQLRLDLNGDETVDVEDSAHLLGLFSTPDYTSLTVGQTYTQDFNSLGAGGTSGASLPAAWSVTDKHGSSIQSEANVAFPTTSRDIRAVSAPHALNVGLPEGEGVGDRGLAIYKPRNTSATSSIQLLADTDTDASALKIDFSVEAWDRLLTTGGNLRGGEAAFNVSVEIDGGDGTSDVSKILGGEFTEILNLGTVTTGADLPKPDGDYLDGNDPAHRVTFASDVLHADIPAGSRLRFRWETTSEADASEEWIFGIDDVSITLAAAGDTDANGEVNFLDFLALAENFGQDGGWAEGDFDGDGQVAFNDFLALAENFGQSVPAAAAAVPEPTGLLMAAFGLLGVVGLRKRR